MKIDLDETQQQEFAETGSLCGQCLDRAAKQLLDLYDAGEITAGAAWEELRVLMGEGA